MCLSHIKIVMVRTSHAGNIGSAARALKTMGLSQLVLVNPDQFPAPEAVWMASGAQDVVESADVYESLDAAVADCTVVIGASARNRSLPSLNLTPKECAQMISGLNSDQSVAILFGRESSGLSNSELALCHYQLVIPANEVYPVLNVAMAIQIVVYELRQASLTVSEGVRPMMPVSATAWDTELAKVKDIEYFFEHLESTLQAISFLDPKCPKQIMARLRRLFMRVHLDEMELGLLRGILTSVQRNVRKKEVRV